MKDLTQLNKINSAIENYFKKNSSLSIVPVKNLMPDFISAGIFAKDHKNGMPIRKIIRELDKTEQLDLIPTLFADRKGDDTYWYFIPTGAPVPTTSYKQEEKSLDKKKSISSRENSDETYVIDLCNTVLELKANRQKRFDFLLGDLHKDKFSQTKLPVDAFYESLKLVVEYREIEDTESEISTDEYYKKTASGVSREEQRKIYDKRKEDVLPKNDIELVIISSSDFTTDPQNKISRDKENDLKIIENKLQKFIAEEE